MLRQGRRCRQCLSICWRRWLHPHCSAAAPSSGTKPGWRSSQRMQVLLSPDLLQCREKVKLCEHHDLKLGCFYQNKRKLCLEHDAELVDEVDQLKDADIYASLEYKLNHMNELWTYMRLSCIRASRTQWVCCTNLCDRRRNKRKHARISSLYVFTYAAGDVDYSSWIILQYTKSHVLLWTMSRKDFTTSPRFLLQKQ